MRNIKLFYVVTLFVYWLLAFGNRHVVAEVSSIPTANPIVGTALAARTAGSFAGLNCMVVFTGDSSYGHCVVKWCLNGKKFEQRLALPDPWHLVHYSAGDPTPRYESPCIFCPEITSPTLIVRAAKDSGVYGITAPVVFQLLSGRWRRIGGDLQNLEFTDRGSFYVSGDRLYVWDYVMNSDFAHRDPQRYALRTYKLTRNSLRLKSYRTTSLFYPDVNNLGYPVPEHVPKQYDPLREFGMRWKWWGDSESTAH